MQENELWVLAKRDLEECGSLLAACLGLVLLLAALLQPFVPSLSSKVRPPACAIAPALQDHCGAGRA